MNSVLFYLQLVCSVDEGVGAVYDEDGDEKQDQESGVQADLC